MKIITRLLLFVAVLAAIYSVIIFLSVCWYAVGWFVLLFVLAICGRRGAVYLTTLGSARFATLKEMKKAQMFSDKPGLIIGREKRRFGKGRLIRLSNAVHSAIYAPTGAGKGVSMIIPFLLTCRDNVFVIDFKGELALETAYARERMGHEVIIVDPYKLVTQ